ncbi:MAG: hypothetical protein PHN53_04830 [Eubacteriales bacterium]|nr:hypothetical protein [Eubacteriales bacterium]MDD4743903.1 hypothetical protein [Eubacteriales bacterium]
MVSDQIRDTAKRIFGRIRAGFAALGEQLRTFGEAVSGRVRTWTDARRRPTPKAPVRRVGISERMDSTAQVTKLINQNKKRPKRIRPIRRLSRQRVYRLQGYTTVSKINSRRKSEKRQRLLRQLLLYLIIILVVIMLFYLYNPIRDLAEWSRIIGIRDIKDLTGTTVMPTPVITPTITPTA